MYVAIAQATEAEAAEHEAAAQAAFEREWALAVRIYCAVAALR